MFGPFPPYVSVADRRKKALALMQKRTKAGKIVIPIEPFKGNKIAKTFWGQAWCKHIECLSDFESRLDRGKTYVRNGSVCHLQISKGRVDACVGGSELYDISVQIDALPAKSWAAIKKQCAGRIASAVELLQGKFSDSVMTILTDAKHGMFPHANDFRLDCNCPDYVMLCKHLAAVLYGVGVRLDEQPELLFTLRGVDHFELIDEAASVNLSAPASEMENTIADADLADVFGIDLQVPDVAMVASPRKTAKNTAKASKTAPSMKKPNYKPVVRIHNQAAGKSAKAKPK